MKKIPSLFQRNYNTDRLVRDEVVPGCEWVLAGEGIPTVKIDGTSCAIIGGLFHKRYEIKGARKAPEGFVDAQDADLITGDIPGWVPVDPNNPADRWHGEAYLLSAPLEDGTYELLGPKVQGNPYGLDNHILIAHSSAEKIQDDPRTFDAIKAYLATHEIEGIVWHHPDGRMCKIKRRDFGYPWPVKVQAS